MTMNPLPEKLEWNELDQKAVDTARVLTMDAVENTGNGHPGTAMSLAPVGYLLFQKVMNTDPEDADWAGRDRFILSPGHAALLQYNQLYLGGYGLEPEDLKHLRTWDSKTPGHPEYSHSPQREGNRHTPGIEMTTGPLGQGLATSVGFAYSQRYMRGLLDPETPERESLFDNYVYVIASDGDLQEGVTSEASSLAGTQELGNLIVIWDDNRISIEDNTKIAFNEDVLNRYESYGWHTQTVDWLKTGNYEEDVNALYEAIRNAQQETDKPSLIDLRTIIGWPAPTKQNSDKVHGNALGAEEVAAAKKIIGFDPNKTFEAPREVVEYTRKLKNRGEKKKQEWLEQFKMWEKNNPDAAKLYERLKAKQLPPELDSVIPKFDGGTEMSTRVASGKVINAIASVMPELWGGSCDLASSNNTTIEGAKSFLPLDRGTDMWSPSPYGRILHFGIREHAAAAIMNGIQLSSPTRSFAGTFLVFSDYQKPAVRLSALMGLPSTYIWTHDSIGLGEDGPTHQSVEQLASLRALPNFDVVRPADANETAVAWQTLLKKQDRPVGLVLTRQNVPTFERGDSSAQNGQLASAQETAKGAYIISESSTQPPDVILIGTGSEVQIALEAQKELEKENIGTRVVSMPSWEWFAEQDKKYHEKVLPPEVKARVSVEAAHSQGWEKFVGDQGRSVSLDHFGASAAAPVLFEKFNITPDAVVKAAQESLKEVKNS